MQTLDDFTRGYITAALWSSTAEVLYCPTCRRHVTHANAAGPTEDIPCEWCPECETDLEESDASFDQAGFGADDIEPETLTRMVADCERFQQENRLLLSVYQDAREHGEWTGEELAGHDFWLTRNGHGTGFWDRFYAPSTALIDLSRDDPDKRKQAILARVGDKLSERCEHYGGVDLYLGDDGRIYA